MGSCCDSKHSHYENEMKRLEEIGELEIDSKRKMEENELKETPKEQDSEHTFSRKESKTSSYQDKKTDSVIEIEAQLENQYSKQEYEQQPVGQVNNFINHSEDTTNARLHQEFKSSNDQDSDLEINQKASQQSSKRSSKNDIVVQILENNNNNENQENIVIEKEVLENHNQQEVLEEDKKEESLKEEKKTKKKQKEHKHKHKTQHRKQRDDGDNDSEHKSEKSEEGSDEGKKKKHKHQHQHHRRDADQESEARSMHKAKSETRHKPKKHHKEEEEEDLPQQNEEEKKQTKKKEKKHKHHDEMPAKLIDPSKFMYKVTNPQLTKIIKGFLNSVTEEPYEIQINKLSTFDKGNTRFIYEINKIKEELINHPDFKTTGKGKNCQGFKRTDEDGVIVIKSEGILPFTPIECAGYVHELPWKSDYDERLQEVEVVADGPLNTRLNVQRFKGKMGTQGREFSLMHMIILDSETGGTTFISRSIDDSRVKSNKKFLRAKIYYAIWDFKPFRTHTKATYLNKVDFCGKIPGFIINSVLTKQGLLVDVIGLAMLKRFPKK